MTTQGHIGEFDPASPELWDTYAERLEFFLEANAVKDVALKRATLLSICGSATFEISQNLVAPAELRDTSYKDIVGLLQNHFSPQPSRIACRHTFYKQGQAASESVPAYVSVLRHLARRCEFRDPEEMLLDWFVCGLWDERIRRKLFAKEELTFQEAVKEALAFEKAEDAAREIRASRSPATTQKAEAVHHEDTAADRLEEGGVLRIEACQDAMIARNHKHLDPGSGRPLMSPVRALCQLWGTT
ncbi:uncharacterized protein [Tiliqua scincoides]|uniref:uncharacterized protein n=1 Tax=Tiliqua scincoides TaxID=71010 RepID=UPI0034632946